MSASFIVLATNTSKDNFAFGPFSSYEDAQEASFGLNGKDHAHEHVVLQLFDHEKPLPAAVRPPYPQDREKKVLRDMALEELEDLPPFEPVDQPDAPEEEDVDDDGEKDLRSDAFPEGEGEEDTRTLTELRAEASEREIAGRSSMTREELIEAIDSEEG